MEALTDAETEAARKLEDRIDELEGKVEKQTEMLGVISRSIGTISSTM
jgi:uncharacterized coiled-coil protein SlyX